MLHVSAHRQVAIMRLKKYQRKTKENLLCFISLMMAFCLWAKTCNIKSIQHTKWFICCWWLLPALILHILSFLVQGPNLIKSSSVQIHPGSLKCCQVGLSDPTATVHGLWQRRIGITYTRKRHVLWHLIRPVTIQVEWVGFDLCANTLRPSWQQEQYVKFGNKNRDFFFPFPELSRMALGLTQPSTD
jgi:hypothetical protein